MDLLALADEAPEVGICQLQTALKDRMKRQIWANTQQTVHWIYSISQVRRT